MPNKKEPQIKEENGFLTYKGKPLVRNKDTIYYGDMGDPYVALLEILSKTEVNGVSVADKVSVKVLQTDPNANSLELLFKSGEQSSLFEALEISSIWVERANKHFNEK